MDWLLGPGEKQRSWRPHVEEQCAAPVGRTVPQRDPLPDALGLHTDGVTPPVRRHVWLFSLKRLRDSSVLLHICPFSF